MSVKQFLLTPEAQSDLEAISDYIGRESPVAAKRVRTTLRRGMRKLAETPGIGHLRDDLVDEPLRFWRVYSYLIVYRAEPRPIQILRVLHGARDLAALLASE